MHCRPACFNCRCMLAGVSTLTTDIAAYAAKALTDPRTENKRLIVAPPQNVASQNDLIALWEKVSGKQLGRKHLSATELQKQIQGQPLRSPCMHICCWHVICSSILHCLCPNSSSYLLWLARTLQLAHRSIDCTIQLSLVAQSATLCFPAQMDRCHSSYSKFWQMKITKLN